MTWDEMEDEALDWASEHYDIDRPDGDDFLRRTSGFQQQRLRIACREFGRLLVASFQRKRRP